MLLDTMTSNFNNNPAVQSIVHPVGSSRILFERGSTVEPYISNELLSQLEDHVVAVFVMGTTGKWAGMVRDENYHCGFGFGSIDKAIYLAEQRQEVA